MVGRGLYENEEENKERIKEMDKGEGSDKEKYKKKRRHYRELCERIKDEENERWVKRAEKVREDIEVWKIVYRERGGL